MHRIHAGSRTTQDVEVKRMPVFREHSDETGADLNLCPLFLIVTLMVMANGRQIMWLLVTTSLFAANSAAHDTTGGIKGTFYC